MKKVFVQLRYCLGCKSCELACAVEHSATKHLFAAITENPRPQSRIHIELGPGYKVPLTCRHCQNAPCINACAIGAMYRNSHGVIINVGGAQECIGCGMCITACPYGMVGREEQTNLAIKCDLCPDRQTPACVEACPTNALVYAEAEEFASMVRQKAAFALSLER